MVLPQSWSLWDFCLSWTRSRRETAPFLWQGSAAFWSSSRISHMLAKWASPELISRPPFTDLDMQIGSTHTGFVMVIMVGMTLVMFQNIFSHLCSSLCSGENWEPDTNSVGLQEICDEMVAQRSHLATETATLRTTVPELGSPDFRSYLVLMEIVWTLDHGCF